jgi:AcrR family transcriptional regulator
MFDFNFGRHAMATKKSAADKLTDALMEIISRDGWQAATLDKIAELSGVTLGDMAGEIHSRFDLLDHFGRTANARALKIADEEGGSQAVRDKLFSVLMARFDVVLPHKAAIRNLRSAARRDPGLALYFAKSVPTYLSFLLEASGVSTASPRGFIKARGFTALYLKVVQVWLDDETEDQAKTMAAVDKMLGQAETWAKRMEQGSCAMKSKGDWKFWRRNKSNDDMRDITPAVEVV